MLECAMGLLSLYTMNYIYMVNDMFAIFDKHTKDVTKAKIGPLI